ncbi:MAG TPA: tryptophan transporter [Bacillota bacterium]|nr:tryptophan transporter [Bacillota bacterium]
MNLRVLIILSLLVGIGAVLHAVAPPILFGMRPDMLLSMMFLGIILFPKAQYVVLLSIVTGIVSALTTTFPGGELANIIDKPITALLFLGLFLATRNLVNNNILAPVLTAVGTIISGAIFLSVGLFIVGVDVGAGFTALLATVVLPATAVNAIVMIVIYPIVQAIMKRSRIATV